MALMEWKCVPGYSILCRIYELWTGGRLGRTSEMARSLGAKVLIDDNPRYAIECAEVGIKVLLFDYENSYPWSKMESVNRHPLVTKVHNWEEVEHQLALWIMS
ncbi:uncharacterized protein Fot_07458 [Forsythia ovata]|uniref:FCP1 homology domain-containing protein n=1 Tax=Forsythia ovata TaxID=205694 RepID=A0ABD1WW03_9LAMI